MTLCVIHPDKAVREALVQTLEAVWGQDIENAPEKPEKPETLTLYLAPPDTGLPETQMIALAGQNLKNLMAAIHAKYHALARPRTIRLGHALLDTVTRDFTADGKTVTLTEKEAAILIYLLQRKTAVTRDDLLREVWQYAEDVDTHTIETHIYRLRQKIETDPENPEVLVTGKDGYQLAAASKA